MSKRREVLRVGLFLLIAFCGLLLSFRFFTKEGKMSVILAATASQPITFYGMVVDQHRTPVAGAQVRGSVEKSTMWLEQKWEEHVATTDSAGRFQFTGLHGQTLVVSPARKGYQYNGGRNFEYSVLTPKGERHHPDPVTPVVFEMWKRQGAEPLINDEKFFGIKADGTPFTIDLKNGEKMEGRAADGDLIVSIRQPAQITHGQKFDWSFTIEAIGGGLVEADSAPYLNEAPAEGYESQIAEDVKAADRDWSNIVPKTFFVKSRNGSQFGCVVAELYADYQGAAVFSIHYLVNPKPGSRNLEHDPSEQDFPR